MAWLIFIVVVAAVVAVAARLGASPGMDINFARTQKWWAEIGNIVETDEETHRRLVENLYANAASSKLEELNFISSTLLQSRDVEATLKILAQRQAQIEHFSKLKNLEEVKDASNV